MNEIDSSRRIGLAKLATILAVTFGVAFGLCGATALLGGLDGAGMWLLYWSAVVEAICLVGLVGVGLLAIVRALLPPGNQPPPAIGS